MAGSGYKVGDNITLPTGWKPYWDGAEDTVFTLEASNVVDGRVISLPPVTSFKSRGKGFIGAYYLAPTLTDGNGTGLKLLVYRTTWINPASNWKPSMNSPIENYQKWFMSN